MKNETLIRKLIGGTLQRAVFESAAALVVVVFFMAALPGTVVGSAQFYGCLLVLIGAGFIAGVVWSHALSYRLLRSHSADDVEFWREAFRTQARLLRLVPLWYCGPLGVGGMLFVAPTTVSEFIPFLMVAGFFLVVFGGIVWLNRRAAACLEDAAMQLTK